jgi:hypothetical protein
MILLKRCPVMFIEEECFRALLYGTKSMVFASSRGRKFQSVAADAAKL